MAPHSSILARRIPWTEEPVVLQSIGSQRGGHDCLSTGLGAGGIFNAPMPGGGFEEVGPCSA